MDALQLNMEAQAAEWFLRRQQGRMSPQDNAALEQWLAASPEHAEVWRQTENTWRSFGDHATLPELVVAREQALASIRRTQSRRWAKPGFLTSKRLFVGAAAIVLSAIISLGLVWQWPARHGEGYGTDVGEQRTVLLPDSTSIVLDALTRVRVQYDEQVRLIELLEGQAQFDVASDPGRPFQVRAGDRIIEAVGTSFTVAYIGQRMSVALIAGRVKVEPIAKVPSASAAPETVLNPGDALSIEPDGEQDLKKDTDLAVATAWRQGKVIFQREPLRNAVERLNRYSRVRLEVVDANIEHWPVSGIFGVADAEAFAEAIASYFPIQAQRSNENVIELRERH